MEKFKEGKIIISDKIDIKDSLMAIRTDQEGEIDLNTVDGSVRAMALANDFFNERQKTADIMSLSDIQNEYFSFIEINFGQIYNKMIEQNLTPDDIAMSLTRKKESINYYIKYLNTFIQTVYEFWERVGETAHIHAENMYSNIKGVFGGDLFPSYTQNIASVCGLYIDTIILPDPFIRTKLVFEKYNDKQKVYYLIKHAMNILQYKDLACTSGIDPIVVIIPDLSILQMEERSFIHKLAKRDTITHCGKLFNRKFSSFKELNDFAGSLNTIEKAISEIHSPDRFIFDSENKGNIKSKITQALACEEYKQFFKTPGKIILADSLGRMCISNEILIKSRMLNGTPIIGAKTSWDYLTLKMGYDAEKAESNLNLNNLHTVRGLQGLANNKMQWLGNIPINSLIEIRRQRAMIEIREVLGKGIKDLTSMSPSDFENSQNEIFNNINEAFNQYEKNISQLKSKKWRFGRDVGAWLVTGTLSIAAIATGHTIYAPAAAYVANQVLDPIKLKDIPKSCKKLIDEDKKINRSPAGLLFSISKGKNI